MTESSADRRRLSAEEVRSQLGIDEQDVQFRKDWTRFGDEHVQALKDLKGLAEENADAVITDFYDQSFAFSEFTKVLDAAGSSRSRLEAAQKQYFLELFGGDYGMRHADRLLAIGTGHHVLGVGPKMYVGSYTNFYQSFIPQIIKRYKRNHKKMDLAIQAFLKITNFDMALSLNSYILGYINEISAQAEVAAKRAEESLEASDAILSSMDEVANAMTQVAKGATDQAATAQGASQSMESLSEVIQRMNSATTDQAEKLQSVNATMQQLTEAIEEIKSNVEEGVQNSKNATENSLNGSKVVAETVEGMNRIRQRVQEGTELINSLGEKSSEIGKIVGVIQDIADQTNLLALNAAIEAARAGDQGRGFAVVAEEVRNLAERVAKATTEIDGLIGNVRDGVEESVEAMQKGTDEAEAGAALAAQAGDALSEILEAVNAATIQVNKIGEASLEMEKMARGAVDSVNSVAAVSQENTAAASEMTDLNDSVASAVEQFAAFSEQNSAASEQVSASLDAARDQATTIAEGSRQVDDSLKTLSAGLERLARLT